MEFRVEEIAPCRKKVTVTVPVERVRQEFDKQLDEINKQFTLPGFRPGRAPRKLLEARFATHLRRDVRETLVEAAFEKAVEDKAVAPLGRPSLDVGEAAVEPGKPFEFAFEVTTRPDFELPAWKGREVRVPPVSIEDAHVDAAVEDLRAREGSLEASDAPLVAGDLAVVDWAAVVDGAEVLSEASAYYRVGGGVLEGVVLEGADAALAGGRPGTTVTVRGRAAPDDPREPLAGREFDVRLEVRETKRFVPAPLDEAFLRRHDFDDVEELRRDVRRRLLREAERARDRLAEERLLDGILADTKLALPQELVERAVTGWAERRRIEGQSEGRPEDDVAKELAADEVRVRELVERDLRRHFVLDRIAEAEGIAVGEKELSAAVEQLARDSGRSAGEVVAHFQEDPGRLGELRTHLRHQKSREALRRAATVVEETAPAPAPAAATPPAKPRKGK